MKQLYIMVIQYGIHTARYICLLLLLTLFPALQAKEPRLGNGTEISLPYTNTLEDLKNGTDFLTAVIALDGNGTATCSASHIWTAVGKEEAWSDDGNTGDLGEVEW